MLYYMWIRMERVISGESYMIHSHWMSCAMLSFRVTITCTWFAALLCVKHFQLLCFFSLSFLTMRHFGKLILRRAFVTKAAVSPRPLATTVIPTMRDYQRECVQICLDSLAQGARKQVVSLPVGMWHVHGEDTIKTFVLTTELFRKWENGNDLSKKRIHDMVVDSKLRIRWWWPILLRKYLIRQVWRPRHWYWLIALNFWSKPAIKSCDFIHHG